MNCPNCGAELTSDSKFCVVCGQPVSAAPVQAQPEPVAYAPTVPVEAAPMEAAPVYAAAPVAQEDAPTSGKLSASSIKEGLGSSLSPVVAKIKPILSNKKVVIGIVAALALVLVIGIIVAIATSGNGFIEMKQVTDFVVSDETLNIVVNGKPISATIDFSDESDCDYDTYPNQNGKVTAIRTDDDELYVLNGKKLNKVADEVSSVSMSVSGKALVYAQYDEDEETYTLYHYTVSSKKSVTISDQYYGGYAISPDGKSVVYKTIDGELYDDDAEIDVMYFKGKKSSKIASQDDEESLSIMGLSNNGKYIYIRCENEDDESTLYSYNKKGNRTKLGAITGYSCSFNSENTQVMFTNEDKTYISNKGKDAEKAASGSLYLLPTSNCGNEVDGSYPVDSLFDHVFVSYDMEDYTASAVLVKKNAEKNVKLVSKLSSVRLDDSAEYLYCIRKGDLQVLEISKGEKAAGKAVTLASDVDSFVVTSDRKLVYYIDGDELYSVNGKKGGSPRCITDDDVSGSLVLNKKDHLFYKVDEDVYVCTNGKKGEQIISDVDYLYGENGFVCVSDGDNYYTTKTSKKLKKVLTLD